MNLFSKNKSSRSNVANTEATAIAVPEEEIPVATMVVDNDDSYLRTSNPQATAPTEYQDQPTSRPMVYNNSDPSFTRFSMMNITCSNCQQAGRTKVRTAPAWQTWAATGVGFLLFWPLCWLPLVMDSCKQSEHFCTNCGHKLGTVPPFQDCCVNTRS
ncbi:unnamed protein product [Cylindrotheca closterium]|uniref:LITAF domain-containing protein n=1 Tax=Cylindrotheca closterium TaxID=2856 RepID=A0AAD2FZG3_9STRA|nr:unnamed protein product [Cylindrotheca closterium]